MRISSAIALIALALAKASLAAEPSHAAPPTEQGRPGSLASPAAESAAAPLSSSPSAKAPAKPAGCLPSGDGFLRARIRGALSLDLNWRDAELECEGGARPDGTGIRLSFAGPLQSDGRRVRMVFGVADAREGSAGSALPTNLTVIFEGEKRLFSTLGEDRCTVDKLSQERVGALGGPVRSYRVVARGFCIQPVSGLVSNERIVVNSFDFAGKIIFTQSATPPAVAPETQTPVAAAKAHK